ncbi:pilin [Candidatus Woesebacteria bacterium]|nr:pilin [Candidatus Woesebacteria bacterium]MCD8506997.1 pilin [Candidatus Woesebacteria bacterium]MCD8527286.1 pilin [Candidatus Woesebacteria bacterium]MCD8546653.1 pilin [Candidatus Woesebacteria bacterium]
MNLSVRTQRFVSSVFSATAFSLYFAESAMAQLGAWTEANGCVFIAEDVGAVATIQGVECLVRNVLASATTFVGLAAFVMLIIGGFLYLTSGSNSKGTDAAKQTITYAIIGIVVALMAFFLLQFVAIVTGARGFLEFNLNLGN